jgi:uncharacterized protein (DUF1697 family)
MKYLALLRGVNVGGHQVKMETLRKLLTESGLQNVRTYIQSGNVVFESTETDRIKLANEMAQLMRKQFGFAIPTVVVPVDQVARLLQANPFQNHTLTEGTRFMAMFLLNQPNVKLELPFVTPKQDFKVIYVDEMVLCGIVYLDKGKWGNPTGFIEKEFKVMMTGRFWHTLHKIVDFAQKD